MPGVANYAHQVNLALPFEHAVKVTVEALKAEGFGILTEIDVRDTLKKKLDLEFRRYLILGACNPPLAHQALSAELHIGLLLPCNAIVYETDDGASAAAFLDPEAMFSLVDNPDLAEVAADARERILRAARSLSDN